MDTINKRLKVIHDISVKQEFERGKNRSWFIDEYNELAWDRSLPVVIILAPFVLIGAIIYPECIVPVLKVILPFAGLFLACVAVFVTSLYLLLAIFKVMEFLRWVFLSFWRLWEWLTKVS